MGNSLTNLFAPHLWREDEPLAYSDIKYDPHFGFDTDRKKKEPNATQLMMDSACLYLPERNDCALQHLRYASCHSYYKPFIWKCSGLRHEVEECYIDQRIHDMKEFEREKRLNRRERLLEEQERARK